MRNDSYLLAPLLGLFAILMAHSWLAWGDVDVDYGREMYVPLRLLEHDVLYRDVRYPYGPFSPYLHMLGYWVWRPHLNVLYADGILTTALIIVVLYDIARTLGGPLTATVAATLIMLDVAFMPGGTETFSFVFPYAYPALHGLLFLATCIAGAFRLLSNATRIAGLVSGTGAGLALLTKPEFGLLALAVVAVTSAGFVVREGRHRSGVLWSMWIPALLSPAIAYGLLATTMPAGTITGRGLFAPEYFTGSRVIAWYIAGLTPNATWQQSARQLMAHWATALPLYGLGLAVMAVAGVLARVLSAWIPGRSAATILGALTAACAWIPWWTRCPPAWYAQLVGAVRGRYALLPLVLAGMAAASSIVLAGEIARGRRLSLPALRYWILSFVALVLLLRVPAKLVPGSYANFLLPIGTVLLVHLAVDRLPVVPFVPAVCQVAMRSSASALLVGLALYVGTCNWAWWARRDVRVTTNRGTVRLQQEPRTAAFRQALAWVTDHASADATLLSIPRGTALSFLSGHGNALYETSLVVTVATGAQERAFVAALVEAPPELILTSAVTQREYGLGPWGVENHRRIRRWIERAYAVTATSDVPGYGLMTLWTRKAHVARRAE